MPRETVHAAAAASAAFFLITATAAASFVQLLLLEDDSDEDEPVRAVEPVPRVVIPNRLGARGVWALHEHDPAIFRHWHRFTVYEMDSILRHLAFPASFRLPRSRGGYRVDAMEAFAMYLRHLARPQTLWDMVKQFGCSETCISQSITHFGDLLHGKVANGMVFDLATMAAKARDYARTIHDAGNIFYPRVIGFLDATHHYICQPSKSQAAVYKGRMKANCVKVQTVVTPDGLFSCVYGPVSGRPHDIILCDQSGLDNLHLRQLNAALDLDVVNPWEPDAFAGHPYTIYGDGAFLTYDFIRHPYLKPRQQELAPQFEAVNTAMASVRSGTVEIGHKLCFTLFQQLGLEQRPTAVLSPVGQALINAFFLTNCFTCLRGNQIADFMAEEAGEELKVGMEAASLADYISRVCPLLDQPQDPVPPPPENLGIAGAASHPAGLPFSPMGGQLEAEDE